MKLFQSLRNRSFLLLWSGQTLSRLGDSVYRVALVWWVLQKTGSASAVARMLVCSYVPLLLFVLLGGITIDRFSRVKVMLLSDLSRAAVVFTVSILAAWGQLEVWHLYVASAVFGSVNAFFQPAYTVVVPEIVATEALTSANSVTNLSKQLADVAGPALGAMILALTSTSIAFFVNGFSFVVSAFCLFPLLKLSSSNSTPRSPSLISDLREGFKTVLSSPWLWITIAISSIGNVTMNGPLSVGLPFLIKNDMQRNVGSLGLVYSMLALGCVVASVWLGRSGKVRHRGLTFYTTFLIAAVVIISLAWPMQIVAVAIAVFIIGATLTSSALIWTNTLQDSVSRDVLGRVASIDYLGSYALLPIGYSLSGWAADRWGSSVVFLLGGSISILLGLLALSSRVVRNLD
jgi:MFS family permease